MATIQISPFFKRWCLESKNFNPDSIRDREDILEALLNEYEQYVEECKESYLEDELDGLDENDIY